MKQEGYLFFRDISLGAHKQIVVPSDRFWTLMWAHIRVQTSQAHGLRCLNMWLTLASDPTRPIARALAPVYQPENSVGRYQFFPGVSADHYTEPRNEDVVIVPLPNRAVMLPGWIINIGDIHNISPADHVEIRGMVVLEEK